jgi:sulfur relay protein TusB/DsrH
MGADALTACLPLANPGDFVLLLADGASALPRIGELPLPEGVVFAALATDAAARGLGPVAGAAGILLLPDDDFAELLTRHRHCLSWT